jgi:hypothetical protein
MALFFSYIVTYPLIRYQTLFQTEHTTGNYTKIYQHFSRGAAHSFKGIMPYMVQNVVDSVPFYRLKMGYVSAFWLPLTYPFQRAQILAASAGNNKSPDIAEIVKNYTHAGQWRGFVGYFISNWFKKAFMISITLMDSFLLSSFLVSSIIIVDNYRRNFTLQTNESSISVFKNILHNGGILGLFRGVFFYPEFYLLLCIPIFKEIIKRQMEIKVNTSSH